MRYAKGVAPIFGTVSPPVATTRDEAASAPPPVSTRKTAPSRTTPRTSQGWRHSTRPFSHSAMSMSMIRFELSSQKSCPSVFS